MNAPAPAIANRIHPADKLVAALDEAIEGLSALRECVQRERWLFKLDPPYRSIDEASVAEVHAAFLHELARPICALVSSAAMSGDYSYDISGDIDDAVNAIDTAICYELAGAIFAHADNWSEGKTAGWKSWRDHFARVQAQVKRGG